MSAADDEPEDKCQQADSHHGGNEDEGDAVDDALHGSLGALSLLHHADDVGQHGLLAYLGGAETEGRSLKGDGACEDAVAGALGYGGGFAGNHGFVDVSGKTAYHSGGGGGGCRGGAGRCGGDADDDAVDGNLFARAHLDGVAGLQGGYGHVGDGAVLYQVGGLGLQAHEGADGRGRAMLGALLQEAAGKHEGDNHHRGVVIGVVINATSAPDGLAPERVEHAEEERHGGAQGHQRVHIGRGVDELLPRRRVELSAAVDDVEQGQDETHLIGQHRGSHAALRCRGRTYIYPPHGDGHHQQGEEPRQHHLAQQRGVLPALDGLHVAVFLNHHVVAYLPQLGFHLLQGDAAFVVLH